ncbi:MAG: CapA family protein [Anaerolineae bacterium]|nr:CapA family protein [Anaerolineae bacterium]
MNTFHKMKTIGLCVFMLMLVLNGCRYPSTAIPTISGSKQPTATAERAMIPTSTIMHIPTPTQAGVSLPLLIQAIPVGSPTPALASTVIQVPTAAASPTQAITPAPAADITLLFTGVIVPARCVQSAIDARGDANYVYGAVRDIISSADLAVGTLNTTLSDLSTHTGCIVTYVLVSDARSAVAAASAGFDVMSVATNHIKNCSGASCADSYNRAFFDTLDNLRANNIQPVGAGMNMEDALQPVVMEVKGIRFGIVSLGMVEPMAFAGADSPGIAPLTDENLQAAIANVKGESDVVIVMPHWGPEDSAAPTSYQRHFAQVSVDAGADVVVGNHTHVVQAIQQINGVDVFYGLGNFIFDQTWDLAHQQGVILLLHFSGMQYTGYEIIPTHVDGDGTVHIAGPDEATSIIERIEAASALLK